MLSLMERREEKQIQVIIPLIEAKLNQRLSGIVPVFNVPISKCKSKNQEEL